MKLGFIGGADDQAFGRANEIIESLRKQRRVLGSEPEWEVTFSDQEVTQDEAIAVLADGLKAIDDHWDDVLRIYPAG